MKRRTEGEPQAEVLITIPPSEEIDELLQTAGLLIPGIPGQAGAAFIDRIAGKQLTPREIAVCWAEAREVTMGKPESLGDRFDRFMVGLHGTDIIKVLIPDKRLAKQVTDCFPSAYRQVIGQA